MYPPYLSLELNAKKKPVLEVTVGRDKSEKTKRFAATRDNVAKIASYLDKVADENYMHSSSLNFPHEYGVDFDLLEEINKQWAALRLQKIVPVRWWVLLVRIENGKIMEGDTAMNFLSKSEAVDQAKYLSEQEDTDENRIYIAKLFANGQMRYEEFE